MMGIHHHKFEPIFFIILEFHKFISHRDFLDSNQTFVDISIDRFSEETYGEKI